eukprot:COSAG02_NODE_11036_length_1807_cov_1.346604_1_plen_500_part_10
MRVSERVCLSYTPSHETVWMIGTQNHPCLCGVSEQPTRVERAPPGRLTGRTTLFFWVPSSIKMAAERSTVVWLSVEQTQWRLFTVMCTYHVLCAVLCCAVLCCAQGVSTTELRATSKRHSNAAEHEPALTAQQAVVGGLLDAGGRASVPQEEWSRLVTLFNSYALHLIRPGGRRILLAGEAVDTDDAAVAVVQLRMAEVLCLSDRLLPDAPIRHGLASMTATNFSCLHRDAGRWYTALRYSLAALEHDNRGRLDPSVSHLNCCATLSQLERHDEALRHARMACKVVADSGLRTVVGAAAYFNRGAQQMALGMLGQAAISLRKAIEMHPRSTLSTNGDATQPEWVSLDEMECRLDDCERKIHDEEMFGPSRPDLPRTLGRTNAVSRSKSADVKTRSPVDSASLPQLKPHLQSKQTKGSTPQLRSVVHSHRKTPDDPQQRKQLLRTNTPPNNCIKHSQAQSLLPTPRRLSAGDQQRRWRQQQQQQPSLQPRLRTSGQQQSGF